MQRNSYKNYGFKLSKPLFTKYVKLLYLCGAIFVFEKAYTKMAPQGCTTIITDQAWSATGTLRCRYLCGQF